METTKQTIKPNYLVAIVGRPNVGKSTLFNALVGKKQAILSDIPGTTRDILYGDVSWNRVNFTIADTAGIELDKKSELDKDILAQTRMAIESADLIIFLTNVREGLQNEDKRAAELIRKLNKPVVLAVNKAEGRKYDDIAHEFYSLGLGEPLLISAIRGRGTGDLLDDTVNILKKIKKPKTQKISATKEKPRIKIAILGRPNVGKSTLFNKLAGEKKSIVSDKAGTTRDTINTTIDTDDLEIEITDTAGLRRRGKIEKGIEKFSLLRVIKTLQDTDIAILLIEGPEGILAQDLHIAQIILESKIGFIIAINKWDAIEKTGKIVAEYDKYLEQKMAFVKWAPHLYISALTGQRTEKIIDIVKQTWESLNTKIPSKRLNTIIGDAYANNPPKGKRKPPKIYFASISRLNPPTIKLKVNYPEEIHFSYLRYLENKIRMEFPLPGSPIRWELVKSSTKELI